jgi:hypothetical protein
MTSGNEDNGEKDRRGRKGAEDPRRATSGGASGPAAASTPTSATQEALDGLLALRGDCLKKLNEIAARVQHRTNQAGWDLLRAFNEAQFSVQSAQQESFQNYMTAIQSAGAQAYVPSGMNEITQRCAQDFRSAQSAAQKSVEGASDRVAAVLKNDIDAANREWDETCAHYLRKLQEQVAHVDPGASDPALLAAFGQSLLWVSTHVRGPASNRATPGG